MKYNYFIAQIYLISLFFIACSNKTNNEKFLENFDNIQLMEAKPKAFESDKLGRPYLMDFYKNKLVFIEYGTEYLMNIFNATTGKWEQNMAPLGQGPNEFLWITSVGTDHERFMTYDGNLKRINYFEMSEDSILPCKKETYIQTSPEFITAFKVFLLTKNKHIASGIIKDAHWAIIDSTGNMTKKFDSYPVDPHFPGLLTDDDIAMAYQGTFTTNPSQTKAMYTYSNGIILRFCSIEESGYLTRNKELIYEYPRFKENSTEKIKSVVFSENNLNSFISIKSTENYCFLLYSGLTALEASKEKGAWHTGNKLLIFDWDGNPVKAIYLPLRYSMFAVNAQERLVYLLTTNDESATDDYSLHILDLKNDFKYL